MRRAHEMPFGASYREGHAVFRLFAPASARVTLDLDGHEIEAERDQDGFWTARAPARPGARYRYRLGDGLAIPDPASRFQPQGVHGPSIVIDPYSYEWSDAAWRGRPWREAVVYELHVGAFTPEGTFDGVRARLDYLAQLGVTALEIMPVAAFAGARNWGYDGVLPFAPHHAYGTPDEFKILVDSAHARGLMVILDVVYNHFGPDGNYLHTYAPGFFTDRFRTPWGPAINFDGGAAARVVREFFIHNALYWLDEFHLDGLRLDAVHAIFDTSEPDIVQEMAARIAEGPGARREIHLILENGDNDARYLRDGAARAQWNDDFHHAMHVLLTGEGHGYYGDYLNDAPAKLACCLSEGFAFQGEPSAYLGRPRGSATAGVPLAAFLNFLQNHDQIGNRAFGERLGALAAPEAVRAATVIALLAPSPPLLFMGQEWGASTPFLFFCDFPPALARAVRDGRRAEFAHVPGFADEQARDRVPDPCDVDSFARSRLDWSECALASHAQWLAFHRDLLRLRAREIVPRLGAVEAGSGVARATGRVVEASWPAYDGVVVMKANLSAVEVAVHAAAPARVLYETHAGAHAASRLPPWAVWVGVEAA